MSSRHRNLVPLGRWHTTVSIEWVLILLLCIRQKVSKCKSDTTGPFLTSTAFWGLLEAWKDVAVNFTKTHFLKLMVKTFSEQTDTQSLLYYHDYTDARCNK